MSSRILAERYEVQRQLGKQTGRQTLLASDLQTQKLVVIKQLSCVASRLPMVLERERGRRGEGERL